MTTPAQKAFQELIEILNELREKCPWDKKQTFESLSHLTIEEVYELTDAIRNNQPEELKKEIGDVLLHLVFYAKIASEQNLFTIEDVINSLNKKLIDRHPHIYDPNHQKVETEAEVKKLWEVNKLKKGAKSVLSGVPKGLPAIVKSYRLQDKASGVGFDWDNPEDVWNKVQEEIQEFEEAKADKNQDEMEAEFGDVLFALVNYARFHKINPEQALQRTNDKFITRFQKMEELMQAENIDISTLNLEQMDAYWNKVKRIERGEE